jgi:hypothetical protein
VTTTAPFIRHVTVLAGPFTEDVPPGPESQALPIFSDGGRSSLRVTFNVSKTSQSYANNINIELTNLSQRQRQRISQRKTRIRLYVGWANTPAILLAQGGVFNAISRKDGADIITQLTVLDGFEGMRQGLVNRTFGPRTSVASIVEAVRLTMPGVALGAIQVTGTVGSGGLTLSDRSAPALDRLAEQYGFTWSIQNGALYALQDGQAFSRTLTLSAANRTLLKVFPLLEGTEQNNLRVKADALLDPRMVPLNQVRIESAVTPDISGVYKITNVDYDGDTHGSTWQMSVEGILLRGA